MLNIINPIIELAGYSVNEFNNYKDLDNKYIKSIAMSYYDYKRISPKQLQLVYNILTDIRLSNKIYLEYKDEGQF